VVPASPRYTNDSISKCHEKGQKGKMLWIKFESLNVLLFCRLIFFRCDRNHICDLSPLDAACHAANVTNTQLYDGTHWDTLEHTLREKPFRVGTNWDTLGHTHAGQNMHAIA
jgi:hypothetical protein